jgi:hypothetical protein
VLILVFVAQWVVVTRDCICQRHEYLLSEDLGKARTRLGSAVLGDLKDAERTRNV